jgi:hypothetical protein
MKMIVFYLTVLQVDTKPEPPPVPMEHSKTVSINNKELAPVHTEHSA